MMCVASCGKAILNWRLAFSSKLARGSFLPDHLLSGLQGSTGFLALGAKGQGIAGVLVSGMMTPRIDRRYAFFITTTYVSLSTSLVYEKVKQP